MKWRQRRLAPYGLAFLGIGLWLLVIALVPQVYPDFRTAEIRGEGGATTQVRWPFLVSAEPQAGAYTLSLDLPAASLRPEKFLVVAEGVMKSVTVNGAVPHPEQFPIEPDTFSGACLDLTGAFHSGINRIVFHMERPMGRAGLRISAHPRDHLHMGFVILLVSAVAVTLAPLRHLGPFQNLAGWIVFGGIALRIWYFCVTPYYLRGYDQGGHIQYIKYFAKHLALPSPDLGWQMHQPPLYYVICGSWLHFTGQSDNGSWIYGQWQVFALILSIACMLLAPLIAREIFGRQNSETTTCWFILILAVFPGLLFFAARINNDVLFGFLAFVWIWLLMRWWNSPSWVSWLWLCVVVGLTCLTKNSGMVLLGVTAIAGVLRRGGLKPVIRRGATLGVAVIVVSGWWQMRSVSSAEDSSSVVIGNIHRTDESLRIPGKMADLFTFNPLQVIKIPFNDTRADEYRRTYFPEFYFKSALFGEWPWGGHLLLPARALVICAMVLIGFSFFGLFKGGLGEVSAPLLVVAGAILIAQMLLVIREPYTSCQDFRFFAIQLVPVGAFAVRFAQNLPTGTGELAIGAFAVTSVGFLFSLVCI